MIERTYAIARIAFASTYPPRRCGIAAFTHNLSATMGGREVVALLSAERGMSYPVEVHHRIRPDERVDHRSTARAVSDCVDVVAIQHDFAIWGGEDGEYVLDFVRELDVPAVVTLHTILPTPTERQRAILTELIGTVAATVVMSPSAAALLTSEYGVKARYIDTIPHGVPDLPFVDTATIKPAVGLEGRDVILGFGLVGPDKGYELVIDALPAVVAAHPETTFAIVGTTNPDQLTSMGEAYRASLVARVAARGMNAHVRFIDRFVGRVEMTRWLEAADIIVTPHVNLAKTVSGTLSYALGAGRAVVSTPFAYATDLLADGRGVLVPPASPELMAAALNDLLADPERRVAIGRRAHEESRGKVWSKIGAEYSRVFDRVTASSRAVPATAGRG